MKSEKYDARRIVLEMLGPPAIGALSFLFYDTYQRDNFPPDTDTVIIFLVFGYWFALIPSLIYTTLMERVMKRGLQPKTWQCVGFSSLLGLLSGLVIAIFVGSIDDEKHALDVLGNLALDGLWTGFVMGLLLKGLAHWRDRNIPPSARPPSPSPHVIPPPPSPPLP